MVRISFAALFVSIAMSVTSAVAGIRCYAIDFVFPSEPGASGAYRLEGTWTLPGAYSMAEFGMIARARCERYRTAHGYRLAIPYFTGQGRQQVKVNISGCSPSGRMVWYDGSVTVPGAKTTIKVPESALRSQRCD